MKQYAVIHRDENCVYSLWSSYDSLEEIPEDMYEEFLEARLGNEYIVLDTSGTGNAIVTTYCIERRVVRRSVGALESAWPLQEKVSCYPKPIGDGAELLRFIGRLGAE